MSLHLLLQCHCLLLLSFDKEQLRQVAHFLHHLSTSHDQTHHLLQRLFLLRASRTDLLLLLLLGSRRRTRARSKVHHLDRPFRVDARVVRTTTKRGNVRRSHRQQRLRTLVGSLLEERRHTRHRRDARKRRGVRRHRPHRGRIYVGTDVSLLPFTSSSFSVSRFVF